MYAHDIIGGLNNGMHAFIDWNLVLNTAGGPNHVGNYCEAPVMCNTETGEWHKNLSWHYLRHFSHWLRPGATRIGHSLYTTKLETTAFQNTNGSITGVILNQTNEAIPLTLRYHKQLCHINIPPASISTFVL